MMALVELQFIYEYVGLSKLFRTFLQPRGPINLRYVFFWLHFKIVRAFDNLRIIISFSLFHNLILLLIFWDLIYAADVFLPIRSQQIDFPPVLIFEDEVCSLISKLSFCRMKLVKELSFVTLIEIQDLKRRVIFIKVELVDDCNVGIQLR